MVRKNKIVQIGGERIEFSEKVLGKFDYLYLPGNYDFVSDEQYTKIFKNGKFNRKASRNVYIFGTDATLLQNFPAQLEQFPTMQLFYDKEALVEKGQKQILDSKLSRAISMRQDVNLDDVFENILDLAVEQSGYKLSMDYISVRETFQGQVNKKGNVCLELEGDFGNELKQVVTWKLHPYGIAAGQRIAFVPEVEIIEGELELEYQLAFFDPVKSEISSIIKGSPEEFINEVVVIENNIGHDQFVALSLYARGGEGKVQIGQVHFRNAFYDKSVMMATGKKIIDPMVRKEEIFHYFYPGDMKPPLAVYFSGYRSAEGFEGRGMMGRMGCPFILIADPRLEGGNFYLGSKELEEKVVQVIRERLAWLGFTKDQLILSGLSMGTFGSLYYAADLEPASVIIGKPLCNLGDIAKNERINRPEIWGTSLDMVMHFAGSATDEGADALNEHFWKKFNKGKFNNTTFAVAYMYQDDYDTNAFPMLEESLTKYNPEARILYKGFIGRHNDNSSGVNSWFIKQYRNILWKDYNRRIDYRF